MRALSLRCPFPWLMVKGYKPWENRSWNTHKRGWVLVHASLQWTAADLRLALDMLRELEDPAEPELVAMRHVLEQDVPPAARSQPWLQNGGIVGAMRIDSVAPVLRVGYGTPVPPWRILGQYGFKIGAAEELPFTPCGGRQGFWRVSFHLQRVLEEKTPPWLWAELQKND